MEHVDELWLRGVFGLLVLGFVHEALAADGHEDVILYEELVFVLKLREWELGDWGAYLNHTLEHFLSQTALSL